jgi:predicted transcriptional regulator
MATKPKHKSEEVTIKARVEPKLKKRVNAYAEEQERSESFVVRTAVTRFLDQQEKALQAQ